MFVLLIWVDKIKVPQPEHEENYRGGMLYSYSATGDFYTACTKRHKRMNECETLYQEKAFAAKASEHIHKDE